MSGDFSFQEVVGQIRELVRDDLRFSVALRWQLQMKLDLIDQFPRPVSTLQLKVEISNDLWGWMQVSNYALPGQQLQICPFREFRNPSHDRRITPDDLQKLREACSQDFKIGEIIAMIDMLGKEAKVKNNPLHTTSCAQQLPVDDNSMALSGPIPSPYIVVGKRKSSARKKKSSASKNATNQIARDNGPGRDDLHKLLDLVMSRNPRVAAAIIEEYRRPLFKQIVSLAITRLDNLTVADFCRVIERRIMFSQLVQAPDEAEAEHYIAVAKICGFFVLELIGDPSDEDLKTVKDWIFRQRRLFRDALKEASPEGQQRCGNNMVESRAWREPLKLWQNPAQ